MSAYRDRSGRVEVAARRARPAVFLTFFLNGFAVALWVVNVPAVKHATNVGNATLGTTLLALGAGSLIAMQLAGHVVARVGSRAVVGAGASLLAIGALLISAADDVWQLAFALFVFGLGNGAIDIAMNDQAVIVQRCYGRPIISAFHAFYSVGGAAGAGLGALLHDAGIGDRSSLAGTAALTFVLGIAVTTRLLRHRAEPAYAPEDPGTAPTPSPRGRLIRRAAPLAALAFAFMLAEGMVNDWSALQATEHLHRSSSAASLAYLCFAVTMTVGRLVGDRLALAAGAEELVRVGSLTAGAGLVMVVASPLYPITLIGWVLFGAGLAGTVPQIFAAAGALTTGPRGAIILSRVVSAGYLGSLAGPAIIGWISAATGVDLALIFPLLLVIVGGFTASAVQPRQRQPTRAGHQPQPLA